MLNLVDERCIREENLTGHILAGRRRISNDSLV